jgi:hypothetical protein
VLKGIFILLAVTLPAASTMMYAAQLSSDARGTIPHDVQQLIVIDYRVLQSTSLAASMRDRVIPPVLKQFSDALDKSGLDNNHDVDQLAFALLSNDESSERAMTVGIAQGQFPLPEILANFNKRKIKVATVRANKLYPLPNTGMVVSFLGSSTMVFGSFSAVKKALEAHDGLSSTMLTNEHIMDAMKRVDSNPLWSILDERGTQAMMRQVLGDAGSVTDFESVRKHLQGSSYAMDFQHGVKFDLTLSTGDAIAATTLSSLLNAAVAVRKMSASEEEKRALSATSIDSDSGRLLVHFATTESEFNGLLQSPLFQGMIR